MDVPNISELPKNEVPPQKKKRNHFTIEKRVEAMRKVKKMVAMGYSYDEMQTALLKEGMKVSTGLLFKFILAAKEELMSTEEATRLIVERVEKRKIIEKAALNILAEIINERNASAEQKRACRYSLKDQVYAIKNVMEVVSDVDDFLSRFNVIPAIPARTEFEIKPKVDVHALLSAIKEEIKEKERAKEEANEKEK